MTKKQIEEYNKKVDEAFNLYKDGNISLKDISDKVGLGYQATAFEFRKAGINLRRNDLRF